ncbi:MAG: phosphodiester glycosidase family protein [Candidatus Berkelbacteria bacterium]|nr:phosphodiester glycosidase family protein [Candidatus Berkelbacteria bacterium]
MFCTLILLISSSSCLAHKGSIHVKSEKWFDMNSYYTDLVLASSIRGETVRSMVKRTSATAGTNGGFIVRVKYRGRITARLPIGPVIYRFDDVSACHAPLGRGCVYQDERLHIGQCCTKEEVFYALDAGPLLIKDSKPIKLDKRFQSDILDSFSARSIIAVKGNKFYFMKITGHLTDIRRYLWEKRKMDFAVCMDGGSSSSDDAKVANAIVVFPKTRPVYEQFKQKYFPSEWTKELKPEKTINAPDSTSN